jgi:hypothetical protein
MLIKRKRTLLLIAFDILNDRHCNEEEKEHTELSLIFFK